MMMMINDYVVTQMKTSVQQTTEVVAPMPIAETPWAASCVPVNLDSTEMDSPVQVIQKSFTVVPEDTVSSKLMIYIVLTAVNNL